MYNNSMLFILFVFFNFIYALSPRLKTTDSAEYFQENVVLEGECDSILEELSLFFQGDKRKSFEAYLRKKQSLLRQESKRKVGKNLRFLLCRGSEGEDSEKRDRKDHTYRISHLRDEQNPNPRLAAVREMFSNSTDSMGGHIGRFGSGVKQILYYMQKEGDSIHCESQGWCLDIFFRGKTLYYQLSKSSEYRKGMRIRIKSDNLPQEGDVERELRERFAISRIAYAELNGKKVSHLSPLYSLSGQENIDPQKKIEVRLGGGFLEVTDTGKGADDASLAFMFAACHVSKEQVPAEKEILCTHRPEDIGKKDRVCRVDLCRQGEVITGDEREGDGIRLYIECGLALELQENRENIHITEGLCQVLVSQCKRLLIRKDLPISFRCDAVKKIFLLIKSRSEQGVLYQNMVINFAKKLKELLGDYASQLREVGGMAHSDLSVFIEREEVSFFPEELLTEEDRLMNVKMMKAKQIGVVHHIGGERRDRPLYMVPSEKDIQTPQDMRRQVVDCDWGVFIPENGILSQIFSKRKDLSLEEVTSIEFFLSSLISPVINTTYELDREETHRYQVKWNDSGRQNQETGLKGRESVRRHSSFSDKDGGGEERYDEEGVDLILLEGSGERLPQYFLGHYMSRFKDWGNLVLTRRFWDRPRYHLNDPWVFKR